MQIMSRTLVMFVLIAACMATSIFAAPYDESEQQTGQRSGGYPAALTRDEALIKKLEEGGVPPDVQ